jgi:hypothetical protein
MGRGLGQALLFGGQEPARAPGHPRSKRVGRCRSDRSPSVGPGHAPAARRLTRARPGRGRESTSAATWHLTCARRLPQMIAREQLGGPARGKRGRGGRQPGAFRNGCPGLAIGQADGTPAGPLSIAESQKISLAGCELSLPECLYVLLALLQKKGHFVMHLQCHCFQRRIADRMLSP